MGAAPANAFPHGGAPRATRVRWIVCGLLLLVTANNYFDRQVFGFLAPDLIKRFHWRPRDYTDMVTWFEVAYAAGFLAAGRCLDLLGTRLGLALAVAAWSVVSMLHAAVGGILGFKVVRALLGFTEASHLPAAIKVVAEWFPRQDRALATGVYKAGGEIGAVAVPLLVPWIYLRLGWRWAFLATGASGLAWLAAWLFYYRLPAAHRRVNAAEAAYIGTGPSEPLRPTPWRVLLRHRQTWGYIAAKFLTDAVWHWYLYLLPLFLATRFHLSIKQFGLPLIVVYGIADAGSVGGGWLSSALLRRGWAVTPARNVALLACAIGVLPVLAAPKVASVWVAVALVGLAMAAHQGWTSNLFTIVSDLYPRRAVGTIVGLGGTAGMIGAALLAQLTGHLLATTGDYAAIFLVAGTAYLAALAILHLLAPNFEPLDLAD